MSLRSYNDQIWLEEHPYMLKASDGRYYNGKAGPAWLGSRSEAFRYSSRVEAERKAAMFNNASRLHGLTFEVEC